MSKKSKPDDKMLLLLLKGANIKKLAKIYGVSIQTMKAWIEQAENRKEEQKCQ